MSIYIFVNWDFGLFYLPLDLLSKWLPSYLSFTNSILWCWCNTL